MIIAGLSELELYPVADRGQPNSERVPILVKEHTDMGQFGLMVGVAAQGGFAHPIRDNFFWFGDGLVKPGDWILVYTGSGTPRTDYWHSPPSSKVYSVHWFRDKTMFTNTNIVPILFKAGSVQVGLSPSDLPQLGAPDS